VINVKTIEVRAARLRHPSIVSYHVRRRTKRSGIRKPHSKSQTAFGQLECVLVIPHIQLQISPSTLLHFSHQGSLFLAVEVVLPRLG